VVLANNHSFLYTTYLSFKYILGQKNTFVKKNKQKLASQKTQKQKPNKTDFFML